MPLPLPGALSCGGTFCDTPSIGTTLMRIVLHSGRPGKCSLAGSRRGLLRRNRTGVLPHVPSTPALGVMTPARRLIETLMTTRRPGEFVLPQDRSARPPVIEVQNWIIEQMRSDIARYRSALSPFAAHGE